MSYFNWISVIDLNTKTVLQETKLKIPLSPCVKFKGNEAYFMSMMNRDHGFNFHVVDLTSPTLEPKEIFFEKGVGLNDSRDEKIIHGDEEYILEHASGYEKYQICVLNGESNKLVGTIPLKFTPFLLQIYDPEINTKKTLTIK